MYRSKTKLGDKSRAREELSWLQVQGLEAMSCSIVLHKPATRGKDIFQIKPASSSNRCIKWH